MQMCQDHWDKLKQAIKDRGLDHLGAKNAQEIIQDAKDQIAGKETGFDPLMACNWMIHSKALEVGGMQLLFPNEDGSLKCSICEAIKHRHDSYSQQELAAYGEVTLEMVEKFWIDGPADSVLERCRELGLVPGVQ